MIAFGRHFRFLVSGTHNFVKRVLNFHRTTSRRRFALFFHVRRQARFFKRTPLDRRIAHRIHHSFGVIQHANEGVFRTMSSLLYRAATVRHKSLTFRFLATNTSHITFERRRNRTRHASTQGGNRFVRQVIFQRRTAGGYIANFIMDNQFFLHFHRRRKTTFHTRRSFIFHFFGLSRQRSTLITAYHRRNNFIRRIDRIHTQRTQHATDSSHHVSVQHRQCTARVRLRGLFASASIQRASRGLAIGATQAR